MIEKSTTERILDFFFENPTKEFHLRELARIVKLSMPTIIATTDYLAKKQLIIKKKGTVLTEVAANRESTAFIQMKRVSNLEKVYLSGMVNFLVEQYGHPKAIILFGSFSRGEDTETSDIDIAIFTTKKKQPLLKKYEKLLKRRINVHEVAPEKVSKEFEANLHNGIILEGSW